MHLTIADTLSRTVRQHGNTGGFIDCGLARVQGRRFSAATRIRAAAPLAQASALENLPGANGFIAAMNVLKVLPDGYMQLASVQGMHKLERSKQ